MHAAAKADPVVARFWRGDKSAVAEIIRKSSVRVAVGFADQRMMINGTALHACGYHDFKAAVGELVAAGADPNTACAATGFTP